MKKSESRLSSLKISEIHIYPLNIPRKDVFQIATMTLERVENVLIEIVTNEGLRGWGEASPFHSIAGETQSTSLAAALQLKQLLLGKNPLCLAALAEEMERFLPFNYTIKSAFDMALHDIAARAAGLPLYLFLGGTKRPLETDFTIGIGNVSETREKVQKILDMGFRMIKVKVGIDDESDYQRLKIIRQTCGAETVLRIDANQGWNRQQAVRNLKRFAEFEIQFCEQPCPAPQFAALKYISSHSPIPIMADESLFGPQDALRLIQEDAVPYFNIKLSKSGGIFYALQIARMAKTAGILCMAGGMSESRLGLTAMAHLALADSIFKFFDLDTHFEHGQDPIIGGVRVEKGMVQIPEEPGLGASPDPAFVKTLQEVK